MSAYSVPINIRVWSNKDVTPDKVWHVSAYKSGLEVAGTAQDFDSISGYDAVENYFEQLRLTGEASRMHGNHIYDQIIITESALQAP